MGGLGKHVDGLHPHELEARVHEFGGVGRERSGVARDVDDAPRGGLDDAAHDLLGDPGAGRVDDDHIGAPDPLHELG